MNSDHQLGDQPIEERYREQMTAIAMTLDEFLNGASAQPRERGVKDERKVGFVLLVFEFGEGRLCNYISNGADRRDIVTLMKEQIKRFEGQPDVTGRA